MSQAALTLTITPLVALSHNTLFLAEAWQWVKAATLPCNEAFLRANHMAHAYRRHVSFLKSLPLANPVDVELIGAAVLHLGRTIPHFNQWDGGHLARATWPGIRDPVIETLGAQDILTWARQDLYRRPNSGRGGSSRKPGINVLLRNAADSYLEQLLRHVVEIRYD